MKQGLSKLGQAKQLLRILSAQSASTYANQVIALVIPWLVLTRTGSAVNAGTIAFAMGIAALLGTLCGGLVTDRIGGRRVSVLADALSLTTALALAVALWFDYFSLWFIALTQVLGVFFDGPGQIAKNTTIPTAAQKEKVPIVRAMGLVQTLQGAAMFIGPLTAGLLIAAFGEANTLVLACALFFAAIALVLRLEKQIMSHEHPMSARQAYADMREAVRYILKDPFLGKMQFFGPLYGAILIPLTALVFPAWFVFAQQDSVALGIFLGSIAVGGMIGGASFAALAQRLRQRTWLIWATAAYAAALLGLYFLQPGSVAAVMTGFVAGTALSVMFAVPFAAFYSRTPQKLLGRVNSIGAAMGSLMGALASFSFGWLMQAISAPAVLLICAVLMGGMALACASLPFMRLLDEQVEIPGPGSAAES